MKKLIAAVLSAAMVLGSATSAYAYVPTTYYNNSGNAYVRDLVKYTDTKPVINYETMSGGRYAPAYDNGNGLFKSGDRFKLVATFHVTANTKGTSRWTVTFNKNSGKIVAAVPTGANASDYMTLDFYKAAALSVYDFDFDVKQRGDKGLDLATARKTVTDKRNWTAVDSSGVLYAISGAKKDQGSAEQGGVIKKGENRVFRVDKDYPSLTAEGDGFTVSEKAALLVDYQVTMTLPVTVEGADTTKVFRPEIETKINFNSNARRNGYAWSGAAVRVSEYPNMAGQNIVCGYEIADIMDAVYEALDDLEEDYYSEALITLDSPIIPQAVVKVLKSELKNTDTFTFVYNDLKASFTGREIKKMPTSDITLNYRTSELADIEDILYEAKVEAEYFSFANTRRQDYTGTYTIPTDFDRPYVYQIMSDGVRFLTGTEYEYGEVTFKGPMAQYFVTGKKLTDKVLKKLGNDDDKDDEKDDNKTNGSTGGNEIIIGGGSSSSGSSAAGKVNATVLPTVQKAISQAKAAGVSTVTVKVPYSTKDIIPASVFKEMEAAYTDNNINVKLLLQVKNSKGGVTDQFAIYGQYVYGPKDFQANFSYKKLSNGDINLTIGKKGSSLGSMAFIASRMGTQNLKTSNLVLLKKDASTGRYSKIPRNCYVDSGSYIHCSVLNGGEYVVTDTPSRYL